MKTEREQDLEDYIEHIKSGNFHKRLITCLFIIMTLGVFYFMYHYFFVFRLLEEACLI